MITLVQQPQPQVSAYAPIIFKMVETGANIERLKVRLENAADNSLIVEYYTDFSQKTGTGPYNYEFTVDVSGVMRGSVDPQFTKKASTLLAPINQLQKIGDKSGIDVVAKFTTLSRGSDNLLSEDANTVTADTFTALSLITEAEDFGVGAYTLFTERPPLTQHIIRHAVRLNDRHHICIVASENITHILVAVTPKSGVTTFGVAPLIAISGAVHNTRIVSYACGPQEVNLFGPWTGDAPNIGANTKSYQVQFGKLVGQDFTPYSLPTDFDLVDPCAADLRLHWLNKLGAIDAHTFSGALVREISVKGEDAKSSIVAVTDPELRGLTRVASQISHGWAATSRLSDPVQAEFLAGVLSSSEVYWERPNNRELVPVSVSSGKATISNNQTAGEFIEIFVTYANERRAHTL